MPQVSEMPEAPDMYLDQVGAVCKRQQTISIHVQFSGAHAQNNGALVQAWLELF